MKNEEGKTILCVATVTATMTTKANVKAKKSFRSGLVAMKFDDDDRKKLTAKLKEATMESLEQNGADKKFNRIAINVTYKTLECDLFLNNINE